MEPRIFVSSTFYDLKYVREQIGRFIESYGFKPVLFENGDVGYRLNEALDLSCFAEMQNCDMAILIVGGRYGSPVSDECSDDDAKKDKFKEYMSITCKEFNTAIKRRTPVYVFIDAAVNEQYNLYRANKETIESKKVELNFPAVDNVNVFRFISAIRTIPHLQVESFTRTNDIEKYLKKQWAGLFRQYLHDYKKVEAIEDVEVPMQDVLSKLKQMEIMLDRIGKIVIGAGSHEMDIVLEEKEIEETASKFARTFEFLMLNPTLEKIEDYLNFFIDKLIESNIGNFLDLPFSDDAADLQTFYSTFIHNSTQVTDVKIRLTFDSSFMSRLQKYKTKLIPKLLEHSNLKLMKFV